MKSYSEKNSSIFPPEPKPFKKKKDYISINGTVIKSTLDTGNPHTHSSVQGKKKKPKQIPNQKRKKETTDLISPIQTQQQPLRYSPASRVEPLPAVRYRPIESPKRPFSLPLIEKKQSSLHGTERVQEQPLRSSTGEKLLRHPPSTVPSLTQTNSLNSLSLQIDIATDEVITKKEKRQWREFKTLTEDHHRDDETRGDHLSDLVRLNSIGKGSSASVYKSVLFPSLQVVADKVVVLSNKEKSSQIISELKSLKTALQSGDSCDSIVNLLEVYPNPRDGTISMCLEYMNGGSLQEVVRSGGCQNEDVLAGLSTMILTGIAHLHSKRQLHRDIKPGNILLNCEEDRTLPASGGQKYCQGRVKISDFGLSKELEKGHSLADSFLGTFHYMSPERISGGDYSFPSDIWSFGMTILAVALGRYPFVTPKSARSLDHSGEVITEGDGGYWAILQAIQERPSIRSLLSSCQHHCGHRHSHSPAGFQGTSNSASPTDHSTTSPPHFSKAFHSFLSQCLQKDPKQRPSAQTLLQHPFFQSHPVTSFSAPTGDAFALTPASHLTDDFIRHCCASHKENLEAKAISARNRLSHNSLFFNASERELDPLARVSAVATPGGSVAPRSGEKTADNNAHRRRIRKPSVSETFATGVAVPGAVSSAVVTGEVQNEGVKQLRTVVKAYREYLNRAWGKKIKTKGPSPAPTPGTGSSLLNLDITSSQAAERIILATLTPLHSRAVLLHLSDALNVPLSLVNKSFQKIIRELKDHLASASSTAPSSTAHIFTDASLTGFPSSETNTPPAVDSSTRVSVRQSKESSARPAVTPPQEAEQGQEADSMDRSDGSDTAAVAELRALMNTRSSPVAAGGFGSLQTAVEMLQRTHREDVVAAEDDDQDEERDEDAALSPERPLPEDLYEFWSERGAQQGEQEQEAGDLYGQGDVEDEGILSSALPLSPLNPRSVSPSDDGHGGDEEQAGEGEEGEEEDYDDDFEEEHE